MDTKRIAELRELLAKASDGEWEVQRLLGLGAVALEITTESFDVVSATVGLRRESDARLIAAMHSALPALLDAVEEVEILRGELAASRETGAKLLEGVSEGRIMGECVGHELRSLTAERDRLKAVVERVEALAATWERRSRGVECTYSPTIRRLFGRRAEDLRAALKETL